MVPANDATSTDARSVVIAFVVNAVLSFNGFIHQSSSNLIFTAFA
jgi:hypothetical protein